MYSCYEKKYIFNILYNKTFIIKFVYYLCFVLVCFVFLNIKSYNMFCNCKSVKMYKYVGRIVKHIIKKI